MGVMNMDDVLKTFSGKRVFVTGHTGFKGTWLTFLLKELGANVMGFSLPPATEPNHFDLLNLDSEINHIVGDICDASALLKSMMEFQPEFVFHMAAQALVRPSYDDPITTIQTNVLGSAHLLAAVSKIKSVRSLVYITSDKCYENVEWVWGYRENDQLGGRDPYSASKAAAEIIFASYANSFFQKRDKLGAASTRAGNVIGGGDWAIDRIIPDCVRAIEAERPIHLRNPHSTRPWQHVLEPLSGYLMLGANLFKSPKEFAGSWNFGPSTQKIRTVQDVATVIIDHLGRGKIEIDDCQDQPHEAGLLQLNCDKAHQFLGWFPRWNVDKTLKATAEWYKTVMNGGDVKSCTLSQLKDYFPELI